MNMDVSRVTMLGGGRTGAAVFAWVKRHGGSVTLVPDTRAAAPSYPDGTTLVVTSPGVPASSPWHTAARARGLPLFSDIQLAFFAARSKVVAVTGTNGKSTVTDWTAHMLNRAGVRARALGNFGTPWIAEADALGVDDVAVVELSSFQLECTAGLRAQVMCVLNVTPDHMDRHGDMTAYAACKAKIFEGARAGDMLILNGDDPVCRAMTPPVPPLYITNAWENDAVCKAAALPLAGRHNVFNAACVANIGLFLGLSPERVREGLLSYGGLPHRLQRVTEIDGVTFFNDSKATNPDATLCACAAMTGATVLIVGGSGKGGDFTPLFASLPETVVAAVATGATADRMTADAGRAGYKAVYVEQAFDAAVTTAFALAKARAPANVLLAPACASFDRFPSYAQRGEAFCAAVGGLQAGACAVRRGLRD